MKKKFFLLMILTILFTGCGDEEVKEIKIPYVKTQQVTLNNVNNENIYSGKVCGRYESDLAFQVGGKILRRNVEVGSYVRRGDLLFVMDSKDILQQSNQGDAQVRAFLAQLKLAETNLNRYKQLFSQDAISAAMLDEYQTNYDAALANYQNAVAISNQSHNALEYTNLNSNANGVISAINAEVGQIVSAGQTILTLVQTDELEVEINIPENKLSEIEIGRICEISFWANSETVNGSVREISPMADAMSKTYRVRISIPNSNKIQLGMTASANFTARDLKGVILPLSAIYQTGANSQVWIVTSENKTALKNVKVENFSDNEVLVSGLKAGEVVITAGVHKLREGQEVRTR